MSRFFNILFFAAAAPFVMPPSAVVSGINAEGGWRQNGEMPLSYRQTQAHFGAKFSAAGWQHKHTVELAKDRMVESWERGGEILTFMVWGMAPDRTGFSWGVSQKSDGGPRRNLEPSRRKRENHSRKNTKEKIR